MARSSAGINIAADADDWYDTIKAFKSFPADIKREVARNGMHLAKPLADEIRAAGKSKGSHAARVADTVKAGMKSGVPSVTAGGLPYTMGSEWGGGKRYKRIQVRPTVFGRRVPPFKRHTTMQFRPYKGEGKWFNPTLQSSKGVNAVLEAWRDLVDNVIRTF